MPGFEVIGEEEKAEILDVLSRKTLFRYGFNEERQGIYKVETFEKEFARYCGAPTCPRRVLGHGCPQGRPCGPGRGSRG